jgi:hypothetical protein
MHPLKVLIHKIQPCFTTCVVGFVWMQYARVFWLFAYCLECKLLLVNFLCVFKFSLSAELRVSSDVDLKKYLQMTDECFKVLSHLLKLHTDKQSTRIRRAQEEKKTSTSSPLKMGPIRCPETSVKDYHSMLRNTPEERRSQPYFSITLSSNGWRIRMSPSRCGT